MSWLRSLGGAIAREQTCVLIDDIATILERGLRTTLTAAAIGDDAALTSALAAFDHDSDVVRSLARLPDHSVA